MKKQSTSKSFAILGTANILCKILAVIYLPFQIHILSDYGNGIAGDGYIIWTFLYSISNAGLPNAISKMVSEQAAKNNFRAAQKILRCAYVVLLTLGIVGALFMALGAKFIAVKILSQPHAYLMLLTISPTLIFTSVSCALRGYYQGRQNIVPVAISNVVEQLLNSVFTVVFAWLLIRYGYDAGAAGTTIGTLVGAVGAAAFLSFVFFSLNGRQRKREVLHANPDAPVISTKWIYKEIIRYAIPAMFSALAVNASSLIDSVVTLPRLEKAGFNEHSATSLFGVYTNQYQRLFTLAIAFSTALVTTLIPAVSEALALENNKLVKHRISSSYKAIYIVTIPSIAGITFLAQPLIKLVFARYNGAELVVFGTWTAILMTIQYVQSAILLASGKPVASSVNMIIGMAVKLVISYYLISVPSINIKGTIIGTAVGWIIAIVLNQISINKCFSFKVYFVRMMIKPAFASAVMGVICFLFYTGLFKFAELIAKFKEKSIVGIVVNDITVLAAIGLGAGIYFSVMVLIHGVTKSDIQRLPMGSKIYRVLIKVPPLKAALEV